MSVNGDTGKEWRPSGADEAIRIPKRNRRSASGKPGASAGKIRTNTREIHVPKAVWIVSAAVFVILIGTLVYYLGFVVRHITVYGNAVYRSEEIVAASGIVPGETRLYSFNAFTAAKNVRKQYPRISSMTVRRSAPSAVTITVTEETPRYAAEIYGETRTLSAGLRVLEKADIQSAGTGDLKHLLLPKIRTAFAGDSLKFYDEREQRAVASILRLADESEIADRITGIDMRRIFDIRFIIDELYLVEAGSADQAEQSLRALAALLRSKDFQRFGETELRIIIPDKGAITVLPSAGLDLYE